MNDEIAELLENLRADKSQIYRPAIESLAALAPANEDVVAQMISILDQGGFYERYRALDVLNRLLRAGDGEHATPAIPALSKLLLDKNVEDSLRSYSASVLGQVGGEDVFDAFTKVSRSGDSKAKVASINAIRRNREGRYETVASISLLVELLNDADSWMNGHDAFEGFGASATPHLQKALASERPFVRLGVAVTLFSNDEKSHEECLKTLESLLMHPDVEVRRSTAFAYSHYFKEASLPSQSSLIAGLSDKDGKVVARCGQALGEVGSEVSVIAIPAITKALAFESSDLQEQWKTRSDLTYALGMFGKAAEPALPVMFATFSDAPDVSWLDDFLWAIGEIKSKTRRKADRIRSKINQGAIESVGVAIGDARKMVGK